MAPVSLLLLQTGFFPNPPFMTKYLGEETLMGNDLMAQIHPTTARKFGLKQGDRVSLESAAGSIQVGVHLFEGAMPQVIFVPLGMGHEAFDPTLKNRGANPFPMLDKILDPASGLPISWVTRVRIQKI
jgi:menaquinone reductase, molybdopterin-binding-like subunit